MKRPGAIKTIQFIICLLLTAAALYCIFSDSRLYQLIAQDPQARTLAFLLWLSLGVSYVFLFLDFRSYAALKRENSELDAAVYTDPLTGTANREGCDAFIARYAQNTMPEGMGCITLILSNLHEINKREGRDGGDRALRQFADVLTEAAGADGPAGSRSGDVFIGRNGGDKFLVIMRNDAGRKIPDLLHKMSEILRSREAEGKGILQYTAGSASAGVDDVRSLAVLAALSDKRAGGNTELGDD